MASPVLLRWLAEEDVCPSKYFCPLKLRWQAEVQADRWNETQSEVAASQAFPLQPTLQKFIFLER